MNIWLVFETILAVLSSIVLFVTVFEINKKNARLLLFVIPLGVLLIALNVVFKYIDTKGTLDYLLFISVFFFEFLFLLSFLAITYKKQLTTMNLLSFFTAFINAFLAFYMISIIKEAFLHFVNYKSLFSILMYVVLTPMFYVIVKYFYMKVHNIVRYFLPHRMWLLTLYAVAVIVEIFIYSGLIKLTSTRVLRLEIFIVAILSVYYISFVGFYLFLRSYEKEIINLNISRLNERRIDMIIEQVRKSQEKEKALRILKHDMRHILTTIYSLIQDNKNNEAINVIQSYEATIDTKATTFFLKDPVINAVLSYFHDKCLEAQIPLFIKIVDVDDKLKETNVNIDDLSLIIANIMENSYNASVKTKDPFIKFIFVNNHNRLILRVSNKYDEQVKFNKYHSPTSNMHEHGIGSKSINYYCEKNNLKLDYEMDDDIFTINIMFN